MSDPHSLSGGTPRAIGNGSHGTNFLFDDWNLSEEKSLTEETVLLDGKIIARMPDLGAERLIKNIERPKFFSFWGQAYSSVLSLIQRKTSESTHCIVRTRQQFFQRVASFGGVILLCGVGILLLDQDKDEPSVDSIFSVNLRDLRNKPIAENVASAESKESAFSPVLSPEIPDLASNVLVPVADVASVPSPVVTPPARAESVWSRPVADSYSPWSVASRQPANPSPPPSNFATTLGTAPAVPQGAVAMTPMAPMAPMSSSSMPVSPHERQLLAQSHLPANVPVNVPVRPPANTNVPPYNQPPMSGMMPGMAPPPNVQQSLPQQYQQRANNANIPPSALHGQYGQYAPYAATPSGPMPPNVPIPSGASTLPAQNGFYQQPPYGAGSLPRPSGDFYSAPPTYRRY